MTLFIWTAEMYEGWRQAIVLASVQAEISIAFDSYWKDNNE